MVQLCQSLKCSEIQNQNLLYLKRLFDKYMRILYLENMRQLKEMQQNKKLKIFFSYILNYNMVQKYINKIFINKIFYLALIQKEHEDY